MSVPYSPVVVFLFFVFNLFPRDITFVLLFLAYLFQANACQDSGDLCLY